MSDFFDARGFVVGEWELILEERRQELLKLCECKDEEYNELLLPYDVGRRNRNLLIHFGFWMTGKKEIPAIICRYLKKFRVCSKNYPILEKSLSVS